MAKKTIEQLQEEARRAEERAKRLKEKIKKQTKAEEAKLNAEIIKAIDEWRMSLRTPIAREDVPQKLREWTEKNEQRKAQE